MEFQSSVDVVLVLVDIAIFQSNLYEYRVALAGREFEHFNQHSDVVSCV